MSRLPESGHGWTIYERVYAGSRPFERTKLEPLSKRRSFDSIDIVRRRDRRKTFVSALEALGCSWKYAKAQPTAAVRRAQSRSAVRLVLTTCACLAAMLLLVVPLLTLEADARGGGGHGGGGHGGGGHGGGGHGGFGGHRGGGGGFRAAHIGRAHIGRAHIGRAHIGRAHIGRAHIGRAHIAGRSVGGSRLQRTGVAASRLGGRAGDPGRRVFGNRAIANVALQSQFGQARFHGAFSGSAWPWWRGGVALGWFGPLFWPYAYYDLFDYAYWPYAYDDFWPYAYDDVYYGIYGPYAYSGRYGYRPYADPNGHYAGRRARRGVSSGRYAAQANGTERAAEVCSDDAAQLTNWPIERISEVVQPTAAQRPALDELRAASAKAIDMLKVACPKDLPSIPTGRLAAMESRLQVMLAAVQTVRPALERFYQSLSDEQKARFNAIASADDPDAAANDRRDLTKWCDEKTPGPPDLPIDRIAQAVQPTPVQRAALDELKDASVNAGQRLKTDCPAYQTLTPTGRVEAMEKRLDATLTAVKTIQPPLAKFYNSLSDEQKARFNSLRSASRPTG
jgi:LTXXQ motif family protein